MTDKVKAALARLAGKKYPHEEFSILLDYELLAREYLCEHPADDDEPVTVELLREYIPHFDQVATVVGGEKIVRVGIQFMIGRTTRGQLRRLLSALEE